MSIRKIGGIYFWRIGAIGGSVYIVRNGRGRVLVDATFAICVGIAFGLFVGFNI